MLETYLSLRCRKRAETCCCIGGVEHGHVVIVSLWDFTDEQGKAVPQGNYKVVVEATLFFDSDIIYSGTFSTKDKAGDIKLASTLTKEDEQHKNMVTNVKAVLK